LTLRLAALAVGAGIGAKLFPDVTSIVTSYLFIPYDSLGFGPDYPFPILDLGWTLNYEMFFYALFACFMGFRRDIAVPAAVASLAGGILIAMLFPPDNLAIRFWLHPISLEFAAGAVMALLFIHGLVLSGAVRIALIVGGLAWWLVPVSWFGDTSAPGFYTWIRVMVWGAGAVMIIAGAALGPTTFKSAWSRAVVNLGDSSYALYLLHPFVFLVFKALLGKITLPQVFYWPLVLLVTALAVVAAALFHRYAEIPVVTFLREKTRRRANVPAIRLS
jgi:peptidoglycan/LPS O-acetylase OafA/YrhL